MKTFDASRPAVAASAIGIARAALEFTTRKSWPKKALRLITPSRYMR
ncbi:MAG: hypothetical protein R3C44_06305 [Chloroflexota bacterium]